MKPMMRWTGDLESFRELRAFQTWKRRAKLWALVSGGGFVLFVLLVWGPGRLPDSVHVPAWVVVSIMAVIGLPSFYLLGVAFGHVVRADRARRREASVGQVVYTNRVAGWIDTHGLLVGLAVVGLILAGCVVWTLFEQR